MNRMGMVGLLTNFFGALALLILVLPIGGLVSALPPEFIWISLIVGHLAAWFLEAVVLGGCILSGAFDWIPVRSSVRWAMVLTAHALIGLATMALLPNGPAEPLRLFVATLVPVAVVSYSLLLWNANWRLRVPTGLIRVPAILCGGVAAALATVSVPATVETIRDNWRQVEWNLQQTEQRRETQLREERTALARLRTLTAKADLSQLLPFALSESKLASAEAVDRISRLPNLPRHLARLLDSADGMQRNYSAAFIADYYGGSSAPLFCGPLSKHLSGLRKGLDAKLSAPWPQSREYYRWSAKALEATRKLTGSGCSFDWERDQWQRRLDGAPAGLLRDLLLGKLSATDAGPPKLWTLRN